ncbi:nuclear transport factor 2 family protein [Paenibacillus anseongense]|uniref:nuclear transport factor 2 family protein n=1 Tax=Paenibacillus TaxID=44249 RepID=UPI002DC05952|nr:nuclear transport factor 2 family protein [Paenibacillus anseongense]MEC0269574.1 nuclear transport factor 2 family protein [Paenibacillus anseongense]
MLKRKMFQTSLILGLVILTIIISGCTDQNNQAQQAAQDQQAVQITELEQRYHKLEDVEEIKELKARYFRFIDEKKWSEFAELFTPDAKIEIDGNVFTGGEAFANGAGAVIGAAPTVHHGHMPEIDLIDMDNAKGIWAMEDMLTYPATKDAPPGHDGYGSYRETYKRVNGVWKINSLVLTRFRMDPLANWDPNTNPVTGK